MSVSQSVDMRRCARGQSDAELAHDRGKIFDAISERRITAEQLKSSDLYYKIADRIDILPLLESMIDSNDTIYKYNRKQNAYSVIKADDKPMMIHNVD